MGLWVSFLNGTLQTQPYFFHTFNDLPQLADLALRLKGGFEIILLVTYGMEGTLLS